MWDYTQKTAPQEKWGANCETIWADWGWSRRRGAEQKEHFEGDSWFSVRTRLTAMG